MADRYTALRTMQQLQEAEPGLDDDAIARLAFIWFAIMLLIGLIGLVIELT
jgi:hypothetical protein